MTEYVTRDEFDNAMGSVMSGIERATGMLDKVSRTPSKAHLIGTRAPDGSWDPDEPQLRPGEFIRSIALARSRDAAEQAAGKAALEGLLFVNESEVRQFSKATLGLTDATGGWTVPNALIDQINKPARYANPYRQLLSLRTNITSATVDVPWRSTAPSRAVIAPWGETKENVNLVYNGYTATMYTLARIYDLGRQFVQKSAGAAEADVLEELGHAIALGEAYYIINGTGTGEPYGLKTALTNSPATYTSSFTASATTLAGSIAKAIAIAARDLLGRNRTPEAAVMSAYAYGEMISQGTDTAGFFLSGIDGVESLPGFARGTLISPWGIPVIPDAQFEQDDLIVGEWSALKLYTGDSYRVDSSDQAGERWDKNLIGFRGEEEIALDARPAVFSGAFQLVSDILP